ncbi:hypothetical protein B0H12DRAFT_1240158 [Mycena haematopus]|nr:hypothetical protein B0H12DRAFT_1240158 [Mycena haematopus]
MSPRRCALQDLRNREPPTLPPSMVLHLKIPNKIPELDDGEVLRMKTVQVADIVATSKSRGLFDTFFSESTQQALNVSKASRHSRQLHDQFQFIQLFINITIDGLGRPSLGLTHLQPSLSVVLFGRDGIPAAIKDRGTDNSCGSNS